jgi:AhpD family alkylhydroperoxidase
VFLNYKSVMDKNKFNKKRKELMDKMKNSDEFFKEFGLLDDEAFKGGVIPKKYKELTMITVSIAVKCEECIAFHVQESISAGASKEEITEAIKMGLMASGSTGYPYARRAFELSE